MGASDVERSSDTGAATAPEYWSKTTDGSGGTLLVYAVCGGGKRKAVFALGGALVLGGDWMLGRFVTEGEEGP